MQGVKNLTKSFNRKTVLLTGILLAAVLLFACGGKGKQEKEPTAVPTAEISPSPAVQDVTPTEAVTPTQAGDPVSETTPVVTDEPVPTLMESDDADNDDQNSVSAGDLNKQEDDPDDENDDPDDSEDDEDAAGTDDSTATDAQERRASDWEETFLFRIPEFTEGIYSGYKVEETFDRASFTGVSIADVKEYITILSEAGFIHGVETHEREREIIYIAANEDNWIVELSFADGMLSLGSGYREVDKTSPEYLEKIWTSTALIYIPVFEAGRLGSDTEGSDGSHTAVFEDVTDEDVRSYVSLVKEAGFTVDPDEGDSDGFIWYSAEDDNETFCSITYYDGVVRINCGH